MAAIQNVQECEAYERTIIVSNIPVGNFNDEVMASMLKNYFQEASKYGDVENVTYPTRIKGGAFVTFKEIKDVENILKKKKHFLIKEELLPICLTVSHFSENVIYCIFVHLDLSIFGKEVVLENLVTELKEKIPSLDFSSVQPNGMVIVKGSFLAIKRLKEVLLLMVNSLHGNNTNFDSQRKRKKKTISPVWRTSVSSFQPTMPNTTGKEHIIVLDTNVFDYMKNGNKIYGNMLKEFNIESKEIVNDDITTLCLRGSQTSSHSDHLEKVKELIEEYSYSLSLELRKETLSLDGNDMEKKEHIRLACHRFPQILVKYHSKHIDIIGNSTDTYQFKKLVMKSVGKKKVTSPSTMLLDKVSKDSQSQTFLHNQ